jgi:hypothetical protein
MVQSGCPIFIPVREEEKNNNNNKNAHSIIIKTHFRDCPCYFAHIPYLKLYLGSQLSVREAGK